MFLGFSTRFERYYRSKHVEQPKNKGLINYPTQLHLVGHFIRIFIFGLGFRVRFFGLISLLRLSWFYENFYFSFCRMLGDPLSGRICLSIRPSTWFDLIFPFSEWGGCRVFFLILLTHCGRVRHICVFNTVKLGTSASSP